MGHRASTTVNPPKQRPEGERGEELMSAMALVPSYSVLFRDTQAALFSESGPLPIPTRHFIALMVRLITLRENIDFCLYLTWSGPLYRTKFTGYHV